MSKTITVIATDVGYYNGYRNPGDQFQVRADEPKSTWFTPKDSDKSEKGEGLDALGMPRLKEIAAEKGIKFAGNVSKAALIALIENPPHPDDVEDDLA